MSEPSVSLHDPLSEKPKARPLFKSGDRVTITLAPYEAARAAWIARHGEGRAPVVPPAEMMRVNAITWGQDRAGVPIYLYRIALTADAPHEDVWMVPENLLTKVDLT